MRASFVFMTFIIFLQLNIVSAQTIDSTSFFNEFYSLPRQSFEDQDSIKTWIERQISLNAEQSFIAKVCNNAFELAHKTNYKNLEISYSFRLSFIYLRYLYEPDSTIYYGNICYEQLKENGSDYNKGNVLNNIGQAQVIKGNLAEAIEVFQESYEFLRKSSEKESASWPLSNISSLYYWQLEDYEKAIEYALLTLKQLSPDSDSNISSKAFSYRILFHAYNDLGNQSKKEFYFDKIVKNTEKLEVLGDIVSKISLRHAYNDMCFEFLEQGRVDLAEKSLKNLLAINETMKVWYFQWIAVFKYYVQTNNIDKASETYNKIELLKNKKEDINYDSDYLHYLKAKESYFSLIGNKDSLVNTLKERLQVEQLLNESKRKKFEVFANAQFQKSLQDETLAKMEAENKSVVLRARFFLFLFLGAIIFASILFLLNQQIKNKNILLKEDLKNKALIEKQNKQLEQDKKYKNRFFTNIAHELNTPLTMIKGCVEQLKKDTALNKRNNDFFELLDKSNKDLLSMVSQILDLNQFEMSKNPINVYPQKFLLNTLIDELITDFQVIANSKNISLIFKRPKKDLLIYTDKSKLKTILKNLIANALKFTQEGTVTVVLTLDDKEFQISVQDTGYGIPEEEIDLIFNRFYQTTVNNNHTGGSGIGLSICKEYSKLLGGQIIVESEIGKGSLFTLSLPREISVSQNGKDHKLPVKNGSLVLSENKIENGSVENNKKESSFIEKILIVDDNLDICHFLELILKDEYQIITMHNGREALDYLSKHKVTLIITDLMMPVMDGIELIKSLKSNPLLANIPTLVLTARPNENASIDLLKLGIDDYLLKPFDEQQLKASIAHLLLRSSSQDEFKRTLEENTIIDTDTQEKSYQKNLLWLSEIDKIIQGKVSDFDLTIESIATESNLSVSHLNRKIKALTGLTTKKYVREIRFQEARKMLENKDCQSVKAVTYSVGFKSEKYFSRHFKQRFGKYPSELLK